MGGKTGKDNEGAVAFGDSPLFVVQPLFGGIYWSGSPNKKEEVRCVNETKAYAVGSVTNAMRGKELLAKNGLTAYVGRVKPDAATGCGYTLTVTGDQEKATRLLAAAGIRVRLLP